MPTAEDAKKAREQAKAATDAMGGDRDQTNGHRKLLVQRASGIQMEATQWLWEENSQYWLPLGEFTLLGGREDVGKSTMAYGIAAKITQGRLPGTHKGQPRAVIVCATEDSWAKTIAPRLHAAGADLDKVLRVNAVTPEGLPMNVKLPEDIHGLGELIEEEGAVLVILDPLMSAVDSKLDPHKDQSVRLALDPMTALAHKANVAIVGIIHQKKGQADDLRQKLTGSGAFVAVSRSVLYCGLWKPPNSAEDAPRIHLFGQIKNNLGPASDIAYRYNIEGVAGIGRDWRTRRPISSSRIEFDGIETGHIEDLLIEAEKEAQRKRRDLPVVEVTLWLLKFLGDKSIPKQEVLAAAKKAEHASATVERAFKGLGGTSSPIPGAGSRVYWRIPRAEIPTTDTDESDVTDTTDVTDVTDVTPLDGGIGRGVPLVDEILQPSTNGRGVSHQSHQHISARGSDVTPDVTPGSPLCGKCGSVLTGESAKPGCEEIHARWAKAS